MLKCKFSNTFITWINLLPLNPVGSFSQNNTDVKENVILFADKPALPSYVCNRSYKEIHPFCFSPRLCWWSSKHYYQKRCRSSVWNKVIGCIVTTMLTLTASVFERINFGVYTAAWSLPIYFGCQHIKGFQQHCGKVQGSHNSVRDRKQLRRSED